MKTLYFNHLIIGKYGIICHRDYWLAKLLIKLRVPAYACRIGNNISYLRFTYK